MHRLHVEFRIGYITADEVYLLRFPVDLLNLRIAWEVKYHRTRTATAGNIEGAADGPYYILGMTYLV